MGYSKRQMLEREAAIVEFAGLGEFIDAPVKQYSSGMYVRLAFAVSTEVDPDTLLLDEVLSVGDLPFQEKCIERIKSFHLAGKTILFVTHSLSYATSFGDRAILL
jgi:ABC-type polysaccharide/polyol phosphate transport system ATPase subunit